MAVDDFCGQEIAENGVNGASWHIVDWQGCLLGFNWFSWCVCVSILKEVELFEWFFGARKDLRRTCVACGFRTWFHPTDRCHIYIYTWAIIFLTDSVSDKALWYLLLG